MTYCVLLSDENFDKSLKRSVNNISYSNGCTCMFLLHSHRLNTYRYQIVLNLVHHFFYFFWVFLTYKEMPFINKCIADCLASIIET